MERMVAWTLYDFEAGQDDDFAFRSKQVLIGGVEEKRGGGERSATFFLSFWNLLLRSDAGESKRLPFKR